MQDHKPGTIILYHQLNGQERLIVSRAVIQALRRFQVSVPTCDKDRGMQHFYMIINPIDIGEITLVFNQRVRIKAIVTSYNTIYDVNVTSVTQS